MGASRRELTPALLLATLLALGAAPLRAQEPAVAELRGQVLLNGAPAPGAAVVLHTVGPIDSGPLDTLAAGRDGTFRVRLPSVPDPVGRQEVYFASVEHGGVNYFGPLITTAADLDSTYVVRTFDTSPAPAEGAALPLTARYILLEELPDAGWTATDLLHVKHAGDRTLIAVPGGATFVYPLPEGATNLQIGGTQMTPDAATIVGGALRVTSAIPPGEREFVVRYSLPDPFLTVRYPGTTNEAELLIKEPAPPTEVEGLRPVAPVQMDAASTYRRYAGEALQDLTVVVREGEGPPLVPTRWLAVGLALLLATAALWAVLRPHAAVANQPGLGPVAPASLSPFERRQWLLLQVARLDEARDAGQIADADEWATRRRALLERLRDSG